MTKLRKTGLVLLSLFVIAMSGCSQPIPKTQVSLRELVAEYNENAGSVPMLAAYADIELTMFGLPIWSSPNGLLRMRKGPKPLGPHDMVLIGREVSKQVMRVGSSSNDNVYYMWTLMPETRALWGHAKLAGAPGIKHLDIDPMGLQAVLGICQLPSDQSKLPAVTLKMDTTKGRYAYVLGYVTRQPASDKHIMRREYRFAWDEERPDGLSELFWGKQKPRRLEEVNFFDTDGRKVMSATVGDYKPISADSMEDGKPGDPVMPTDIRITWFNDRQKIRASVRLRLSQLHSEETWDAEVCDFLNNVPEEIPDHKIIQVDKDIPFDKEGGGK